MGPSRVGGGVGGQVGTPGGSGGREQEGEGGVQAEEAVERQRPTRLPGCTQRKLPAQSGVVAIAIGGNCGEPVESAAHDDQHQARAALIGASEGDPRSKQRATREQCAEVDRKSTRLNSSHSQISYAVFCLKKK